MSKVGEGRTSDLIKRFENLALDSKTNGPPIRMPKRPSATTTPAKPTTLATAAEGTHLPKPSSDSQPHQISTSVSAALVKGDQEEPDTPPAHMAKPAGAATSSIQDLMTISSYSYTHANSAASTPTSATGAASANSPRQPERRQSLVSGRSRSNTTESVSRVSQSEGQQQQRKVSNPLEPRQKTLITALNRRANIDASIQASSRSWLNSAERRIDEARLDVDSGDLENAYLRFMIACNILSEKIPKQKDFESVRKDPKYVRLHKDISTYVLDELEKLAVELRKRPYVEPKRSVLTPEQVEKMESSFAQKFPENPLSSPLVSGSISAAAVQPSLSDNKWLAARHSTFDEIDAQARRIDANQSHANDTGAVLTGVPGMSRNQPNGIIATTINSPTDGADYASRVGKATIEYFDPNATTCTPKELWGLLEQSRTGVNGRPTVLILDIRPHQDYVWGHIDHRHIVNVDPIGLDKQKCTSKEIASSLVLVSEEQQLWFRQRDDFDIVVYVSQAARSFSDSRSTELPALESVNSAIYHYEFDKPLKRSPLFLIGGFDAWARAMGSERCVWSDDARKSVARASDARVAKNPIMRVTPQPEVTPYSASNYTAYYPPAAAAAVALTANVVPSTDMHAQPGVAGSV
ncbi:ubiquitin-specific protease doa4, partial [Coemansia sp. RSA 2049]